MTGVARHPRVHHQHGPALPARTSPTTPAPPDLDDPLVATAVAHAGLGHAQRAVDDARMTEQHAAIYRERGPGRRTSSDEYDARRPHLASRPRRTDGSRHVGRLDAMTAADTADTNAGTASGGGWPKPTPAPPRGGPGGRTSPSARGAPCARTTAADGDAWDYFPHDHARSRAYRWNEDGMAGVCDERADVLLRPRAVERRRPDPQGADVRARRPRGQPRRGRQGVLVVPRLHADALVDDAGATTTRSGRSRTSELVADNGARGRDEPEYELVDTGVFDDDRYWAVTVDYAKAAPTDLCIVITRREPRARRGDAARAADAVVPQHLGVGPAGRGRRAGDPPGRRAGRRACCRRAPRSAPPAARRTATRRGRCSATTRPTRERLWGVAGRSPYPKDGINDHVVHGAPTVNPARRGTKAALHYVLDVPAGRSPARSGCG